jgi:hypothetical protein
MTISQSRSSVIDFSKPYIDLGLGILMRIPSKPDVNIFGFVDPLSREVWFASFSIMFVIALISLVFDKVGIHIQLFQLRLSPSKAEKSNTSAKGCWESLWKFINLLAIPSSLSRSYSTFPLCPGTTLIEIAVYFKYGKGWNGLRAARYRWVKPANAGWE